MKISLVTMLWLLCTYMYSQNTYYVVEDQRYRDAADKILQKAVGDYFDKAIHFVVAWEYGDGEDNLYPNHRGGVRVFYNFVNAWNQKFDMKRNFKYGISRISTGYSIYLDENLRLIEPVDYQLLKKIYSYYEKKLISEREAEHIALENSKMDTNPTARNRLFYHIDSDKFVWRIVRERQADNVNVEEFEIDAVKGKLLNYRKYKYVDSK